MSFTASRPTATTDSEALTKLCLRFDEILSAAGEGIYGLDLGGRVTFVNSAAAEMTGHSVAELAGRSMHEVIHHTRPCGARFPRDSCAIYAALRDGEVHHIEEEVFWRRDGSSFRVAYTSTPIFRHDRVSGAVVVFRDIGQTKRPQRAVEGALHEVRRLHAHFEVENDQRHGSIVGARRAREIVGRSAAIQRVLRMVEQVAPTDATVLVLGESGTGKELVARAIHERSPRCARPLVTVNCAGIPSSLVESEFFGHEKGAFTGATGRRMGRFELAHGGTIFLDEIGELPLDMQAKLLRVLQEKEIERVGGSRTLALDVRVIAATNRDLQQLVAEGKFRLDLYYRLNVLPIELPPLRERIEDIPLIVANCLEQLQVRLGRTFHGLTNESMAAFESYAWPGNIRELQNALERAAILADGPDLRIDPLPAPVPRTQGPHELIEHPDLRSETMVHHERAHILRVLERTGGKIAGEHGAGAVLGLHPNTLRSRMKRLGIEGHAAGRR